MKSLMMAVGIIVLVIGVLSFLVTVPRYHHEGVRVGDTHIGITTEHHEQLPVAAGVVMVVVGAGLIIAGRSS
jgi:hypothetical protein